MKKTNVLGNEILSQVKVTLVFTGYGRLTITDKAVIWNKSATSFLMFGALATTTTNHLFLPLNKIADVGTYPYWSGGGLVITTNEGKIYKIAFKKKNEFKIAYDYLQNVVNEDFI